MQKQTTEILGKMLCQEKKARLIAVILGIDYSEEKFKEICVKQIEKGLAKYGHTIADCPQDKYDWDEMAMEELVDLIVYSLKKNGSFVCK